VLLLEPSQKLQFLLQVGYQTLPRLKGALRRGEEFLEELVGSDWGRSAEAFVGHD
jgi:hypothetical protein